mgnify:CR=1 FL=1
MTKKSDAPAIRFKGFSDAWEQRELGEVLSFLKDGTHGTHKNSDEGIYLLSAKNIKNGEIIIDETFDRKISKKEFDVIHSTFKLQRNDVLLTIVGSIGEVAILKNPDIMTFQRSVAFLRPNEELISSFLKTEIESDIFQKELSDRKSQSAQPGVYLGELGKIPFTVPLLKEQQQISTYFRHLDTLITLHQRKSEKLTNVKKSMLEKMFPQNGSSYPEIRFKGFTDAWEQRKVQDVADRFDNLRIPVAANLRVHGTTPYYGANGIQDYVEGFTHDGEFVLVAEDGANDLKNYPVKCVNGRIWVNNHAHVLQGKAGIADNSFLAFAISQSDIESLLVGGGRAKLNAETLMSIEFRLPCLQEQYRIGEYLTHLDHLITLHQRELEKLQNIKKSMLEKMFV